MKKILLLICLIIFTSAPLAASKEAELISKIESEGYVLVSNTKTLLGRVMLEFEDKTQQRKIVLNPVNGVIMRDYSEKKHLIAESDTWYQHIFESFFGESKEQGSGDE